DKASPQRVPVTVQFTATTTGGVGAIQLKWWLYDGTGWSVLRDWSTDNLLRWTPTRPNPNYQIYVRAKSPTILGDGYDGPGSNATLNFAVNNIPAAALVSPSTTTLDPKSTYTWNAVAGSTWYQIWVDDSTGTRLTQWYRATAVGCPDGTGTCAVTPSVALRAGTVRRWVQTGGDG